MSRALSASNKAVVPLLVATAPARPRKSATASSNSLTLDPSETIAEESTWPTAFMSSAEILGLECEIEIKLRLCCFAQNSVIHNKAIMFVPQAVEIVDDISTSPKIVVPKSAAMPCCQTCFHRYTRARY